MPPHRYLLSIGAKCCAISTALLLCSGCGGGASSPDSGSAGSGGTSSSGAGAGGTGVAGSPSGASGAANAGSGGGTGTAGSAGSVGSAGSSGSSAGGSTLPPELCSAPLAAADSASPTTVVGDGTAESCTESALSAAVAAGGVITFDCGAANTTIAITQTLIAPTDKDTIIDGNDKVVLDGGGSTQILKAWQDNFRTNDHVLTVQRLVMQNGNDVGQDFVPRDGDELCAWGYKSGGGGAIVTRDMNIHVWGVTFLGNKGPELGPDVAGGAIYSVGSKELVVASSTFKNNTASNGGAIGVLHTGPFIYNSIFENNTATGMAANFAGATGCPTFNHDEQGGAGGLGGAIYMDGQDPETVFCGLSVKGSTSGDLGGAVFRSAYWGLIQDSPKQTVTFDQCTFEGNSSPTGGGGVAYVNNCLFNLTNSSFANNSAGEGDGGALKLTGLTLAADSVTFTDNTASWGGAVAHWAGGPDGVGTATNLTFSGNVPNDTVGDFPQ